MLSCEQINLAIKRAVTSSREVSLSRMTYYGQTPILTLWNLYPLAVVVRSSQAPPWLVGGQLFIVINNSLVFDWETRLLMCGPGGFCQSLGLSACIFIQVLGLFCCNGYRIMSNTGSVYKIRNGVHLSGNQMER